MSGQSQRGVPFNQTVNDTATSRALITLGTPLKFSIFGQAVAGVAGVEPQFVKRGNRRLRQRHHLG